MIVSPLAIYFVIVGEAVYALTLICTVVAAGLSVLGCYALDAYLHMRRRLRETEEREAALKEQVLHYDEGPAQ